MSEGLEDPSNGDLVDGALLASRKGARQEAEMF